MNSEDNSYTLKRDCFGQQIAFKAKEAPFTNSSYLKPDPNLISNYEPKNPNPQSPIPNPHYIIILFNLNFILVFIYNI